jgi:hypothetical protein
MSGSETYSLRLIDVQDPVDVNSGDLPHFDIFRQVAFPSGAVQGGNSVWTANWQFDFGLNILVSSIVSGGVPGNAILAYAHFFCRLTDFTVLSHCDHMMIDLMPQVIYVHPMWYHQHVVHVVLVISAILIRLLVAQVFVESAPRMFAHCSVLDHVVLCSYNSQYDIYRCASMSYSSNYSSPSCITCPSMQFQYSTGQTKCESCPALQVFNVNTTSCICDIGAYPVGSTGR